MKRANEVAIAIPDDISSIDELLSWIADLVREGWIQYEDTGTPPDSRTYHRLLEIFGMKSGYNYSGFLNHMAMTIPLELVDAKMAKTLKKAREPNARQIRYIDDVIRFYNLVCDFLTIQKTAPTGSRPVFDTYTEIVKLYSHTGTIPEDMEV